MSILRRIILPGASYFVTCCLPRPTRFLFDASLWPILAEGFERARERYDFYLLGYVFMPDHWHCLLAPLGNATISQVIGHIKFNSGFYINRSLGRKGPVWEPRFYDHILWQPDEYARVINYMHYNPCAKELAATPADWQWSSWQDYYAESSPVGIDFVPLPTMQDRPATVPSEWRHGKEEWRVVRR